MNRRIEATLIALTVLTVSGCGSDPVAANDDQFLESLFGHWTWIKATGGLAGRELTPETEGFTRSLVITAPNRIEILRNGETEVSTTFRFEPGTADLPIVSSGRFLYERPLLGFPDQSVLITIEGVLVLTDPCCDGFAYEWRETQ